MPIVPNIYAGPGPCEFYRCPMVNFCKENRLACDTFSHFVATGKVLDPCRELVNCGGRFRAGKPEAPVPSRKIFDRIYSVKEAA